MTEAFVLLDLNLISPNPYQPRLDFNHDELVELASSIKENGLIQPIIVRPSPIFGYELVAGERRLKAAKYLDLHEIPAIIKNYTDIESKKISIVENLQRSNLNPIEEGKAYQELINKNQMTHDEIAKYMGKSRPHITNTIRLLQLPPSILTLIEQGKISQGHARALLTLKDKNTQIYWSEQIISEQISVRKLEQLLKDLQKQKKIEKNKIKKDIFIIEQEKKLSEYLGSPVNININNTNSGTISIPFANISDFNRIIHNLK